MATPQGETKVRLFDLLVTELSRTTAENCARLLVSLKQAATLEEATERLNFLPYTIFRNLTPEETAKLQQQLLQAGVPTVAQNSVIACPHCRLSGELEGTLASELRGVHFVCYACNQRFLLAQDDRLLHILLKCEACGSWVRLPANPRPGQYRCTCGALVSYQERVRPQALPAEEAPAQAPVTVLQWQGAEPTLTMAPRRERSVFESFPPALLVVALLVVSFSAAILISWLLWPAPPTPRDQGELLLNAVIKRFTTKTSYGQIIASLGKPQVELEGATRGQKQLIYPQLSLAITVQEQGGKHYYVVAYWLDDKREAHRPVPAP